MLPAGYNNYGTALNYPLATGLTRTEMSSNPLVQLHSFGQSVWLDQMRRSLLTTGELKAAYRQRWPPRPHLESDHLREGHQRQPGLRRAACVNWRVPEAASRTFTRKSLCRTLAAPPTPSAAFTTPATAATDSSASKFLRCWPTTPRRPSKRPRSCSRA